MPVMRASVQLIGLLIVGFWPVSYTYAYGPLGHEIAGDIAALYLCAQATSEVGRLLEGESLGRASRWPDWIRKDPKWRKSKPWHFINVADQGHIADVTGQPGGDVVWAIRKFRDELADPDLSRSRRAEAVRFLAHFIADVHQPLHVGRKKDRGGNKIEIIVDGRTSNLHKFWDAQWLLKLDRKSRGYGTAGQVTSIAALAAGHVDEWRSVGVIDWAGESQLLRPVVYAFDAAAPVELDERYKIEALAVSRERLAAAGVRLAGILNDIFCANAESP